MGWGGSAITAMLGVPLIPLWGVHCYQCPGFYQESPEIWCFFSKTQLLESCDYLSLSAFIFKKYISSPAGWREKLENMTGMWPKGCNMSRPSPHRQI